MFFFHQDSPWIKYFDKEISMIVRGGLVKKWKQVIFVFSAFFVRLKHRNKNGISSKFKKYNFKMTYVNRSRCFGRLTMSAALLPVEVLAQPPP